MSRPVLELTGVKRSYATAAGEIQVLKGVNLTILPGQIVGLIGPSGSGKSSLLHAAGLLEHLDAGRIAIDGQDCSKMSDRQRTATRLLTLGFIYQFHHLLPELSALENVALPCMIAGASKAAAHDRARALLTEMGLAGRLAHQPAQLSGGEQQRVAVARALSNHPKLLLADEPTGNLDPATADQVFAVLMELVRATGLSALIATHNLELAARMDRVVRLDAGRIVGGAI